jgi:hypothetical protein
MSPSALTLALFAAVLAAPPPLAAQDFSAGSAAASWNLNGEELAKFEARVVDVLCELSGDCPDDCGGGARQIGLVRTADDVLILPQKNVQPVFSGAVADLLPYCGQTVEVDGLMVGEPEVTATKFYQVQTVRPMGAAEPVKTDRFTAAWAEAHPDADAIEGPWFRNDPSINAQIEAEGYLGLGKDADAAFIADWF